MYCEATYFLPYELKNVDSLLQKNYLNSYILPINAIVHFFVQQW